MQFFLFDSMLLSKLKVLVTIIQNQIIINMLINTHFIVRQTIFGCRYFVLDVRLKPIAVGTYKVKLSLEMIDTRSR